MPPLLESILAIVQDWEACNGYPMWPGDTQEKKRKFAEFCLNSGFLTPLVESSGALAGFLFFYRGPFADGIDLKRPDNGGPFVVCDCVWIRTDLRGNGTALRALFKKALRENREKVLGGEKLIFQRYRAGQYKERRFNFPRFWRKFNG